MISLESREWERAAGSHMMIGQMCGWLINPPKRWCMTGRDTGISLFGDKTSRYKPRVISRGAALYFRKGLILPLNPLCVLLDIGWWVIARWYYVLINIKRAPT